MRVECSTKLTTTPPNFKPFLPPSPHRRKACLATFSTGLARKMKPQNPVDFSRREVFVVDAARPRLRSVANEARRVTPTEREIFYKSDLTRMASAGLIAIGGRLQ